MTSDFNIITMAIPDFTMPFNVITIVSIYCVCVYIVYVYVYVYICVTDSMGFRIIDVYR